MFNQNKIMKDGNGIKDKRLSVNPHILPTALI